MRKTFALFIAVALGIACIGCHDHHHHHKHHKNAPQPVITRPAPPRPAPRPGLPPRPGAGYQPAPVIVTPQPHR